MNTQASTDAARFVERFDAGWRRGREGFFEHFLPLADEDVLLTQPLMPSVRGHAAFCDFFAPLFAAMPDLHGEVRDWRPTGAGVEIELAIHGTLAGAAVELVSHDRIVLHDGRMLERHARLNPLPLLGAAMRHPRTGLPLLMAIGVARRSASSFARIRG